MRLVYLLAVLLSMNLIILNSSILGASIYDVDDSAGLDYVDQDIGSLNRILDRVDITKVSVEVIDKELRWIIKYVDSPLSNEEVFDGASNGSYLYRVIIEFGVTINGEDGHIWFNLMPTSQYNATSNQSLATTVYVEFVEGPNIVAKGFGLYDVEGNSIEYVVRIPSNISIGSPTENNQYLNLTSYLSQQGKDLVIDTLSFKVEVHREPRDYSGNVDTGDAEDTGNVDSGEPSTGGSAEIENGETGMILQNYIVVVALLVAIALGIFIYFRRR